MKKNKILSFIKIGSILLAIGLPLAILYCNNLIISSVQREKTKSTLYIQEPRIPLSGEILTDENNPYIIECKKALELINNIRAENGLTKLEWSDDLQECAKTRSMEIQTKWSHTRPNGQPWWTVDEDIMYGENLAKGFQTADDVVKAWMKSKDHKENLLYPDFQLCSMYITVDEKGIWYWAQEFY